MSATIHVETLATRLGVTPIGLLSSAIRGVIQAAKGKRLLVVDFAQIEARVLAYLADETHKLDAFRAYDEGTGPDIYTVTAASSFRKTIDEITKEERFLGKIEDLSLGFGGAAGAFMNMAEAYGRDDFNEAFVKGLVADWRDAHENITLFWDNVDRAALAAVRTPLKVFKVDNHCKVAFRCSAANPRCLEMRLPSGRCMRYWYPREGLGRFGNPCIKIEGTDSKTRQWKPQDLWYGALVENIVQATARDILAFSLINLDAAGYTIILSVHDEIICEEPYGKGSIDEMSAIMCERPEWIGDMPLAAEGDEMERYRK